MDVSAYRKLYLRHWHPQSETYSGCDSLLTAINSGWQMAEEVFRQKLFYSGRTVTIYHFTLTHHNTTSVIRVIGNPFVERFVQHRGCTVYSFEERTGTLPYVEAQKIAS